MTTAATAAPPGRPRVAAARRLSPWSLAAVVGVGAVVVLFAILRWTGELPFGSDNDEYLIVAERLRGLDSPLVAGVEGTKYPLGYPALLAVLGWLRLPVAGTAIVLNVVAVAAVAALAAAAASRRAGAVAAAVAAAYVAMNAGLWSSAFSVMPDTLLTLVVAAIALVALRPPTPRRVAALAVLAGVAAALKSIGLVIGVGLAVGLIARREVRRWAWAPAAAALLVTGLMALSVAGLPDHTTGYAETFWLESPYDAAKGEVGVGGVLERTWSRLDVTLRDVGWALTGPHAGVGVAQVLAVGLGALGLAALGRARRLLAPAVLAYVAAILVWPFESIRFGLPLVPVAAVGLGWLAATLLRRAPATAAGGVVVAMAVAAFGVWSGAELDRQRDPEASRLSAFHAAVDDFARWASANIPEGEPIASPDYRELARRLERPVLPVGYTTDASALWEITGGRGAEWFVFVHELVPRRVNISRHLLGSYPDRFVKAYANDLVEVYRVS